MKVPKLGTDPFTLFGPGEIDFKMKIICKPRITITNLTVVFLFIFFAVRIWAAMSVNNSMFFVLISFIPMASLACLFFVNCGFAVFHPKQRMAHIIMSLLIIIMLIWFLPLSINWHMNTQRRWFIQKGIQIFQPMADKIMQNKAKITYGGMPLDALVGCPDVYGYTNADGSITIRFRGRGNWRRAGYFYYSGNKMTVKPGDTIYFGDDCYTNFFHLTNGWYEY